VGYVVKGYSGVVETLEPLVRDPGLKLRIAEWWEEREEEFIGG
jgi:hypothetical protein